MAAFVETFPALQALAPAARHAFVRRIPGVDLSLSKAEVLERLAPHHSAAVAELGFQPQALWTAEQVHGSDVAAVPAASGTTAWISGVDGLLTNEPGVLLGIHVADCCAVYLVDAGSKAVGLLHSGKRGSEGGIIRRAISEMSRLYGTRPADLTVQLSPCIRPPSYEVDIAAMIRRDGIEMGVPPGQIHDCGVCTHEDPANYYSYRREKGRTGRMLALLGLT
jgi:copper oxidase (laccase) domain-containing protein